MSVVSSRSCARRTRRRISHSIGAVPVAARKRRVKVRTLIAARSASASMVIASLRLPAIQSATVAMRSLVRTAIGCTTNCDCPPSRCGGTTMRRAKLLATCAP